MLIMNFKAKYYGIRVNCFVQGPQDEEAGQDRPVIQKSNEVPANAKVSVNFDKQRLQQILLNLVSNALKFTPLGGEVNVHGKVIKSVEDLTFQDEYFTEIVKKAECDFLEVQVEDTGIGIKDEDKAKLFKLFGFLDSSQQLNTKGIGLGLFITKKITQIYGGEIICRSIEGQGSNFVFIVALSSTSSDNQEEITRLKNPKPVPRHLLNVGLQ